MYDEVPAHFPVMVHNFLNDACPAPWTGHGRLVAWPPCSLDLNPQDFFAVDKIQHQESLGGWTSHSIAGVSCATAHVVSILSTCCEFFAKR